MAWPPILSSFSRRPAPCRSDGSAASACWNASIAPSRSPGRSRASPRSNQPGGEAGCEFQRLLQQVDRRRQDRPRRDRRAPARSGDRPIRRRRNRKSRLSFNALAPSYLSGPHASRRPAPADPVRRLLQDRWFLHRPDPAGRQGPDHAWPFRPCAGRPRQGAGDAGNPRHHAPALWREFRRFRPGDPLWRDASR